MPSNQNRRQPGKEPKKYTTLADARASQPKQLGDAIGRPSYMSQLDMKPKFYNSNNKRGGR